MATLVKSYKRFLTKFPFGVQAIQTGLLMGAGDLIAQTAVEGKSFNEINIKRLGQFTFIGTCFVGPPLRFWYGLLDKSLGSNTKTSALKKVFVDQVIFAPFFLATILGVIGIVQGNSIEDIKRKLDHDYMDVLKNNYKLWPAVQLCNFYLVPLQYQVLTVQCVAVFWNTYISWKSNQSVPMKLK